MKKVLTVLALVASVVLSGCATQGERVELTFTLPMGGQNTIVAHDKLLPDWLMNPNELKMNYIVKGTPSATQRRAVEIIEKNCHDFAARTTPHPVVSIVTNGILYGAAGALGVGGGAVLAFKNAKFHEYATYGGVAGGTNGAASGIVSGGTTRIYTTETCFRDVLNNNPEEKIRAMR